ncbi:type 4a pilus biogenesis protein PilO [Deinococcus yavapaiensis]|uniref:Type IV pilus assembly protein PilO n=1 Tax=Deinococcus yavapaiensis KR-236 TaxID=694435 RepID=A0A318SG74_9DEIO|nr:type 4a pilus biogenesis protein PilO [Deinococcus yavapaiensis]PYE56384.1 type IV pilus assembly protein PilO [Deinococcus yavapaiensis KR-236]
MTTRRAELKNPLTNLKGRDIFLLTLAGLVLIGILWYFLLYSARQAEIDAANSQLDTLRPQVDAARLASAQLPGLRQEVAGLEVQRDTLLRALPPTPRFGQVLGEIRQNVLATGAQLDGISQSSGAAAGANIPAGVQPINISLTLDGTFGQLFGVLRSLEAMNRFSTINNLALSLGKVTSFDPQVGGQIGVTVYTYNPNAQGAAPAQPGAAPAPGAPASAPPAPPAGGNP